MKELSYHEIFLKLPVGFAYHQMIYDDKGIPADYIFLEVNPAFELITGLKGKRIIGKRVTQVLPNIKDDHFNWIRYYGEVVSTGVSQAFEQFSEALNRWYRVSVYTPSEGFFITNFVDITKEKAQKTALKQLVETSERLFQMENGIINYQKVTDDLLRLTEAKYAVFNLFEEDGKAFQSVAISGDKGVLRKVSSLLGFTVLGKKWDYDPIREQKISKSDITKFSSIQELAGYTIKKPLLTLLENTFHIGETLLIKIVKNGIMLGDFTIIMDKGKKFMNDELAETYARFIGMTITRLQAETKLHASEEKFRKLVQHSHDIIYTLTPEGIFDYVSPSWTTYLGHSVAEVEGQSFQKFVHPDDLSRCIAFFRRILGSGASPDGRPLILSSDTASNLTESIEYRVWHADGSIRWHNSNTVTLFDAHGTVIGLEGNATDITERKLAEKEVIQTKLNYESFFNDIDDFLFVLDEQGNMLHANQTVIARLGYTIEELVGKSILLIHPSEHREEANRIVGEMLAGRAAFCPVPIETKTGKQIPVETRVTSGFWNGKPVLFGVTKDISQLRLSEEKFSKLFHINPSACGLSDLVNHRYIEVNEAFYSLFGFSQNEVIGNTAVDLGVMSPHTIDTITQKADVFGNIINAEADLRAKNGDIKHVLLSSENIYVQDKIYQYTVVNDITQIRNAENEVKFLSYHDQLTGLFNRRHYDEEIIRINTQENYPITLVMTDMNDLKHVNDTLGHSAGDRFLIDFSNVLNQNFRKCDMVARIGGDEFVILLPKTDSVETAAIITRINLEIASIFVGQIPMSAAFGWETIFNKETLFDSIFKSAEDKMYAEKERYHKKRQYQIDGHGF